MFTSSYYARDLLTFMSIFLFSIAAVLNFERGGICGAILNNKKVPKHQPVLICALSVYLMYRFIDFAQTHMIYLNQKNEVYFV